MDERFQQWADSIRNEGAAPVDPGLPQTRPNLPQSGSNGQGTMTTGLQDLFLKANGAEDTSQYSYNTADVSKKYNVNFKGVNNEEIYAQGQGWTDKMANGVGKGLLLTGTTFLQGTVGLVNGVVSSWKDGRAASFYDNDMNRWLDGINKEAEENWLPNYYTQAEQDASWYSPTKLFSANFLWDGIVKNLGFAAGAALSGNVYSNVLKNIPLTSKLFASGKGAQALAATEEGLLGANKVAETFGKVKSLSDKFINSYSTFNIGGRALVAGLATTGEAGFEAYQNLNEFRNKLIEDYRNEHFGLNPTDAEMADINALADEVGNSSFLLNAGLLTATNYIQFPKILGSSAKLESGLINESVQRNINEITKDAAGNWIKAPSRYGKLLSGIKNIAPYTFSASEAFEEGAQYAISVGTEDYFSKKAKGDAASFIDSVTEGISKTVSTDEGMENILIGGLSGAIMLGRGRYRESRERAANTEAAISEFNKWKISDFTKDTIDAINRGTVIQQERERHLIQGDILESKDSERDYIINYLTPRIKYGRFDLVKSDINDLRLLASSEDGFATIQAENKALPGETREAYLQRLTNLEVTANDMKSLYESLNLRYAGIVNDKGEKVFSGEVMDKMVYAASKVADYDVRIPQLSQALFEAGVDVDAIMDKLITGDANGVNDAYLDVEDLYNNKKIDDDKKQNLEEAIRDVSELTLRRKLFLEEYSDIKKNPEKYKTDTSKQSTTVPGKNDLITNTEEIVVPNEEKDVVIKTKDGDKTVQVGEEYYLGRVVEYDKNGKEVYRFPKLTILGKNEDGTLQIRDNKGERAVSPEVLADYKLGKVSDLAKYKTAKYYLEHINDVFNYNFGKAGGGVRPGRLEYDPENNKLFFVYKDAKGKVKSKEVDNSHFVAQGEFKEPRIKAAYTLKAQTPQQQTAEQEFTSQEELDKSKALLDQKIAARREIVKEVVDETTERIAKVNNKIVAKKEELAKVQEEINELAEFRVKDKYGNTSVVTNFNKVLSRSMKGLSKLTSLKNNLEQEIAELEDVKDELEFNLSYFEDLIDNLRELPESFRDMVAELKDQVAGLESLSLSTGKQINDFSKLIDDVNKTIAKLTNLLKTSIQKFNKDYPDYLKDSLERMKDNPTFSEVQQLKDYVTELALFDDTKKEISFNEDFLKEVNSEIDNLYKQLDEVAKEQRAKEKVLRLFEDTLAKYEAQKAEEQAMARSQSLIRRFLGTMANETQNNVDERAYEPASKKDDLAVVGGTITADQGKPHQIRSNRFGFNFHKLPNRDKIRGIVVTAKTEEEAGVPGLIAHLTDNGKLANPDTVIALVMVEDNEDGTFTLVDVNGKPIPKDVAGEALINESIFQVFPSEKLEATYNKKKESMFRDATSEQRKPIIEGLSQQYATWRKDTLSQEKLGLAQDIDASFGIPKYVTIKNENGVDEKDDTARVSAKDAGLVTDEELGRDRVIKVATTNENVSNGSVTFRTPLGRVFLQVPGGLVKLFNTTIGAKKAETIYKVIHQISKNAMRGDEGINDSAALFDWLRSTVYWGIAKDFQTGERKPAGYNNVWFEESIEDGQPVTKLYISGVENGYSVKFTPTDIESNKGTIITLLSNIYHNTSATKVNKVSVKEPYFEIIDIDKNGEPVVKKWDNYQTYLLSSEGRTPEEVPLTTKLKPIKDTDEVNREGIYFTLNSSADNYAIPSPAPVIAPTTAAVLQPNVSPIAQVQGTARTEPLTTAVSQEVKPAAAPAVAPAGVSMLNGVTENLYPVLTFGNVPYKLNVKALADIIKRMGEGFKLTPAVVKELIDKGAFDFNIPGEVASKLAEAKGKTVEEAQSIIATSIINKAIPQAEAMNIPEEPPFNPPTEEEDDDWNNIQMDAPEDKAYRLQVAKESKRFTPEDWKKLEEFMKNKLPNIPFFRVKKMIKATNGRYAWGMLHKGAIYVTESAETGTGYHEVFEAIWSMFTTPEERQQILQEFKTRKGSFEDRFNPGRIIKYSEATDADIKEELAEEFREFVLFKKSPAIATEGKGLIGKLFADLYNFIKTFFTGENAQVNTANLFARIGNGYYKEYVPYESNLSYAKAGIIDIEDAQGDVYSQYRIKTIPSTQVHEIMQEMTYSTLRDLIKTNESLFTVQELKKSELYNRLKSELIGKEKGLLRWKASQISAAKLKGEMGAEEAASRISNLKQLTKDIENEWEGLVEKHQEFLKTYSIEFDENDNAVIDNENNTGRSDYQDARKVDSFKKSNAAIKLLFATVPYVTSSAEGNKVNRNLSTIGGVTLVPSDKVFITLKNRLFNSVSVPQMLERLRMFAIENPNYEVLYTRLAKTDSAKQKADFSKLTNKHDIQLITAFWQSMRSQNADVKTVFILPSGEVVVGDSNLSNAARQAKQEMLNGILSKIRSGSPYIKYDEKTNKYAATKEVKEYNLDPSKIETYINFLKNIGIEFTAQEYRKLKSNQKAAFINAVDGLHTGFKKYADIREFNRRTLGQDGTLTQLGSIRAVLSNPDFESTYFNLNGEPTQTFIGTNPFSELHDHLANVKNINELSDSPYSYLLTDAFSKDSSVVMKAKYDSKGQPVQEFADLMRTGMADGLINELLGKTKEASKMTFRERKVVEMNLNLMGWYMNLVPGDAAIEWMIKIGNHVSENVLQYGYDEVYKIFESYFIAEVNVAKEDREIVEIKLTPEEKAAGKTPRKSTDLRFFKGILGEELHRKLTSQENLKKDGAKLYADNKGDIDRAVKNFIELKAQNTRKSLEKYGVITNNENGLSADDLAIGDNLTEKSLDLSMRTMATNYIIANIELHKMMYSDPYFYKDELKRTKSFNSPGQSLVSDDEVNDVMDKVYNQGYDVDDIGYDNFDRDYYNSSVIEDVFSVEDLPGYGKGEDETPFEETDGGGYMLYKAYRNFRTRAGNWNSLEELQYQYDVVYEKLVKDPSKITPKERELFNTDDAEAFKKKNPNVKSAYPELKPIVRGSKNDGETFNDVVIDKFALVPLSFRILHELNPESNAIKLYDKMQKSDIDYVVYGTGRKVGAGQQTALYKASGEFNNDDFLEINNIPHSIMYVQSEVPSKDTPLVTQGSQITKLVTMDLLEAGVPVDFMKEEEDFNKRFAAWISLSEDDKLTKSPLYKEILDNQKLLEERIEEGFNGLLKKLGIKKEGNKFILSNVDRMVKTLKDEILKREVNDNITDAFEGFKNGDVVLEATPAYKQIRNILYSIADKNVVKPKISGGQKVQIPSTLLESKRVQVEVINGKKVHKSDVLGFYKNKKGERVCEIMVGRWFDNSVTKNMSDAELLEYLNTTDEGKKILEGIGFRIPTQKQNSIDVFRIKQFLPKQFGDTVVVPSALVKKAGSDFDIDKLSIYLKNVYFGKDGNPKYVPFLGYGEEVKAKLRKMLDEGELIDPKDLSKLTPEALQELDRIIEEEKLTITDSEAGRLIFDLMGGKFDDEITREFILSRTSDEKKEIIVDSFYKRSLENAYIQSLQNIVSDEANFERLTVPNSADQLKDLTNEIVKKIGDEQFDYTSVSSMLDREFMESLRHSFISGKYAIGIAAVSQTNHAQNQRAEIYIDIDRLSKLSEDDKKWLGDAKINFKQYNSVNGKPSLSLAKSADKKDYISDIIGQVIDGFVDIAKGPWIMQLGITPNVASTWLFLTKLGVPIKTTAYFMNQPIVRQYLNTVENAGYSWLFIDDFADVVSSKYSSNVEVVQMPSDTELSEMLGKQPGDLTPLQRGQQEFILQEFFKYAKMAEHLFLVTQGSNFDTATINDPFLVFKKAMQLKRARGTIISSVDDILNSSFIGKLEYISSQMRDAMSTILLSDRTSDDPNKLSIRDLMEGVLTPYINMSDRDFVRISQKAVSDLFDWAVQNDPSQDLNGKISEILLGTSTQQAAADEIMNFVNEIKQKGESDPLFNNYIIQSLQKESKTSTKRTPINLLISGKSNKIYDQNQIIYGFNELKKGLANNAGLYKKLVNLAVLQSGLSTSRISFTTLLPYEDFKDVYNNALFVLDKMPNLGNFYDLNVFERNNWSDSDIVPAKKSKAVQAKKSKKWLYPIELMFMNKNLESAMSKGIIPQVVKLSPFSRESKSDFIVYSWDNPNVSTAQKRELRKKGNYSYINKGLFKKVYDSKGKPLIHRSTDNNGKVYESFLYKMVNAWGDGTRANEFYNEIRTSQIDNGMLIVKEGERTIEIPGTTQQIKKAFSGEVEDRVIEDIYYGKQKSVAPAQTASKKDVVNALKETNTIDKKCNS
jgi:hypothetical protein